MFGEIPFNLASVNSFFQQKMEMEKWILFPFPSDIWCSSDLRILLFQKVEKRHRLKSGIPEILGFCVTLFSVLWFPASPNSPKTSKLPFQGDTGGDLPDVLENRLRFYSCNSISGSLLLLPAWGIRGSPQTHPARPGGSGCCGRAEIKHRNKKKIIFHPFLTQEWSRADPVQDKSQNLG